MPLVKETQLRYLEYINRERAVRHHRYDEEMYQYRLLQLGDMQAVEEGKRLWESDLRGKTSAAKTSADWLRNLKYITVASITLACRFAIIGGLEEERSYNISDLYIQKLDQCTSEEEITKLHTDMMEFYTKEVAEAKKQRVYSKPVIDAMDHICHHLHERQTVDQIAEAVGLSPNYLSAQFKNELGVTVAEYVAEKRIEAAKNMLRYSNFPYDEIASILAYSSQSHFIQVFKKAVGCTPREYRVNICHRGNEFDSGKEEYGEDGEEAP